MANDNWFFLNHKITQGVDVYGIAKKNKLLAKGMTKEMWKMRGGLIISHISSQIDKDINVKNLF